MLFQEPAQTRYDINFPFLGFQVRVHPAFFIMPVILFSPVFEDSEINVGVTLVVLNLIFFVSILVHELGHTFAFRFFGIHSRILLYWMGGLAIPDSFGSWSAASRRSLSSNQQIIVSLAGPFAGICLAGVLVGFVYLLGGRVELDRIGIFPTLRPILDGSTVEENAAMQMFLYIGLFTNFFWSFMNLVPIYPLDGGQVSREVCNQLDPHNGVRNSLIVSVVVGVLIAIWGLTTGSTFMAILFGYLAFMNYQTLNSFGSFGGGGRPW